MVLALPQGNDSTDPHRHRTGSAILGGSLSDRGVRWVRVPNAKDCLRDVFVGVKLPVEVEVDVGAMHAWCSTDLVVYDHDQVGKARANADVVWAGAGCPQLKALASVIAVVGFMTPNANVSSSRSTASRPLLSPATGTEECAGAADLQIPVGENAVLGARERGMCVCVEDC